MLRNPDLTTARRIAQVINAYLHAPAARSLDPGTVLLAVPPSFQGDIVGLVTDVEQLRVEPDQPARVVIDEQNGVIVMGENVRISTVAIAQGNLTIKVTETPQVSQPNPFAPTGQAPINNGGTPATGGTDGVQFSPNGGASTVVVPRTDVQVDEGADKRMAVLPEGVSLQELVNSLNALGVGPRDMISILQAIKAAGALQADIEIM
jgi:flagellar P-ring protein precursor FlgI